MEIGSLNNWGNHFIIRTTSGTQRFAIRSTGQVNIGDSLAPDAALQIQKNTTLPYLYLTNVSGGDVLTVANSGNVGIGTTAPFGKLEVDGNIYIPSSATGNIGIGTVSPRGSIDVDGTIYGQAMMLSSGNTVNSIVTTISSPTNQQIPTAAAVSAFVTSNGSTIIQQLDTNIYVTDDGTPADARLGFNINGSTSVIIDQNGNVGIGTTAPAAGLTISSGVKTYSGSPALTTSGALIKGVTEVDNTLYVDGSIYSSGAIYGDGSHLTGVIGGLTWSLSAADVTMAVNNGYISNGTNAGPSALIFKLPASAAVGSIIAVSGGVSGTSGWQIAQNAGQTIHFGSVSSTTGATGYLASNTQYDSVQLLCVKANTDFAVIASQGNINVGP